MAEQIPPEFERAREYVKVHEQELRESYGPNVIAVLGECGVIDYDTDRFALAQRIERTAHLSIHPLIGTIDNILNPRVVRMHSPRVEREE